MLPIAHIDSSIRMVVLMTTPVTAQALSNHRRHRRRLL
jgi:hypothetical protein